MQGQRPSQPFDGRLMHPALDTAKAHFSGAPLDHLDVPEWGEEPERPLRVFFRSKMTIRERDRLYNKPEGGSYTGFATMARCVALMALDERGKRLFNELDDLHALTYEVDQAIVTRIAARILMVTGQTIPVGDQVDAQKKA